MADEIKRLAKIDYEAGMSVRAIASRYGVGKSTVQDWVKREGWQRDSSGEAVPVHIIQPRAGQSGQAGQPGRTDDGPVVIGSEDYEAIREAARAVLAEVRGTLQANAGDVSARDLRAYAATLLDLRVVLNALSPREIEEQGLKLAALRREAESSSQTDSEIVVRFDNTEGAER